MRTIMALVVALLLVCGDRGSSVPVRPQKTKPANLLVNGSFEDGADPKEFLPLDKGSTDIKGWTVTRGQIDYIGSYWQAAEGKRSIDLHGSPGYGGIQQTFATQKGQRYRVIFSLAGTPGAGVKKVAVRAAGKKGEFRCDGTKTSRAQMGWEKHAWEFQALADKTTLEIHTLETTDPLQGPTLDNVSVVAIAR
jgi:choice-of-anchor C domain-containing protein